MVVSIFSPITLPALATPTSHSQSFPQSSLSMGPSYTFLDLSFPSFPHYLSPPTPLVTVSLFLTSMSLVLFCSLVCFVDSVPLIDDPLQGLHPKNPETPVQKNLCTPMFIATLFTIGKCWKQPKCPSVNEWINNCGTFTQSNTMQQKYYTWS